jgi:hypothetical protein
MFDKKVAAEAQVLADEGSGNVMDRDMHGVDLDHHKYILEVRPPGEAPVRVETKAKVAIFHAPQPGDIVKVSYDPKNHKTEILIEGDPRYDPKIIRANKKQQGEAERQSLLNGAPAPVVSGVVHRVVDDEPQWIVPEVCPECGARVDQSAASTEQHPKCTFCHQPLPHKPVPEDY